jgi:hypothetical protein
MNAVERSNESFTAKKTAGKKDVKKTLVKSEEPSETLDYKRIDSEIRDLRLISRFNRGGRVSNSGRRPSSKTFSTSLILPSNFLLFFGLSLIILLSLKV